MVESSDVKIGEAVKAFAGRPFVVVGVPAFNEERTIAGVVLKAQRYADRVIVCDDGSMDLTETVEKLGADIVLWKV